MLPTLVCAAVKLGKHLRAEGRYRRKNSQPENTDELVRSTAFPPSGRSLYRGAQNVLLQFRGLVRAVAAFAFVADEEHPGRQRGSPCASQSPWDGTSGFPGRWHDSGSLGW